MVPRVQIAVVIDGHINKIDQCQGCQCLGGVSAPWISAWISMTPVRLMQYSSPTRRAHKAGCSCAFRPYSPLYLVSLRVAGRPLYQRLVTGFALLAWSSRHSHRVPCSSGLLSLTMARVGCLLLLLCFLSTASTGRRLQQVGGKFKCRQPGLN